MKLGMASPALELVGRFESVVERFPSKVAVTGEFGTATYDELNRAANSLARCIVERTTGARRPVALLLDQGSPFVTGMMAVLKAVCHYVPLDPHHPTARNAAVVADTAAPIILANARHVDQARAMVSEAALVIDIESASGQFSTLNVDPSPSPDDIGYILYTSGSTGKPKGVVNSHANILHNVDCLSELVGIVPDDRQTLLYPCNVYGAARDIFTTLLNGATLFHYPVRERGYHGLAEWLNENRVTLYCSVASVFRHFVQELADDVRMPHIRSIKLGGEATRYRDIELFKRAQFSDECVVHGGLASTETGTTCHFAVRKTTPATWAEVPLGFAVHDTDILLVDAEGREVATGEVGEIVVRSRHLFLGYHGSAAPAALGAPEADGRRRYATGDLGRLDESGCLHHCGRKDFQVKIRGNRVEIGEVEAQLLTLPAIADAVVTAKLDPHGETRLVAYAVLRDGHLDESELRRFLTEALPDYMVPSAFVQLDELPHTSNGKIDRQALPTPIFGRGPESPSDTPPRDALERTIAAVWEDVLRVPFVGAEDDFFALGGHSMLAAVCVARIGEAVAIELDIVDLLENPTLEELANRIRAKQESCR